jgi:hypothetical protein
MNLFPTNKVHVKKVIVHLSGGLGNQLFQFLKASQLAKENNSEIILNLNWFESPKYRKKGFIENLEKRKPEILRFERVKNCKIEVSRFPRDGRFERFLLLIPSAVLKKFGLISDHQVIGAKSGIKRGSLRVVGHHVSNTFPSDWDINSFLGSVTGTSPKGAINSIGVHVRLGDYLDQNFIVVPTDRYYVSAIREAQKVLPNSKIFIYTDNKTQLRECFPQLVGEADKIVSTNDPISDMIALSENRVIVASNSTYSWWSTQLSNDKLLIIYPSQYFTNSTRDRLEAPRWPINSIALDPISGNY